MNFWQEARCNIPEVTPPPPRFRFFLPSFNDNCGAVSGSPTAAPVLVCSSPHPAPPGGGYQPLADRMGRGLEAAQAMRRGGYLMAGWPDDADEEQCNRVTRQDGQGRPAPGEARSAMCSRCLWAPQPPVSPSEPSAGIHPPTTLPDQARHPTPRSRAQLALGNPQRPLNLGPHPSRTGAAAVEQTHRRRPISFPASAPQMEQISAGPCQAPAPIGPAARPRYRPGPTDLGDLPRTALDGHRSSSMLHDPGFSRPQVGAQHPGLDCSSFLFLDVYAVHPRAHQCVLTPPSTHLGQVQAPLMCSLVASRCSLWACTPLTDLDALALPCWTPGPHLQPHPRPPGAPPRLPRCPPLWANLALAAALKGQGTSLAASSSCRPIATSAFTSSARSRTAWRCATPPLPLTGSHGTGPGHAPVSAGCRTDVLPLNHGMVRAAWATPSPPRLATATATATAASPSLDSRRVAPGGKRPLRAGDHDDDEDCYDGAPRGANLQIVAQLEEAARAADRSHEEACQKAAAQLGELGQVRTQLTEAAQQLHQERAQGDRLAQARAAEAEEARQRVAALEGDLRAAQEREAAPTKTLHFFYSCGFFFYSCGFSWSCLRLIVNDPATEASGSNRIMIALTLLLHALDETLAESALPLHHSQA
ncbi:hypothetical protein PAPYR_13021 [Paratrimastix pyriformis]|uniref:Uncharacterized protein n=1 Tax=Paratrimastix pyriformis TaxID=342808 RepID=A0ABQ8U365_9EUKA|nr:hypothetical protein PAPYR_13021 [Paratrimastix pyriformis]